MTAMLWLIPLAFLFVAIAVWVFMWAVKRGQFDDLDSPGLTVLMDDDLPRHSAPGASAPESAEPESAAPESAEPESAPPETNAGDEYRQQHARTNRPSATRTDRHHDRI